MRTFPKSLIEANSRELEIGTLVDLIPPRSNPALDKLPPDSIIARDFFITTGHAPAKLGQLIEEIQDHITRYTDFPAYLSRCQQAFTAAQELLAQTKTMQGKHDWLECTMEDDRVMARPVSHSKGAATRRKAKAKIREEQQAREPVQIITPIVRQETPTAPAPVATTEPKTPLDSAPLPFVHLGERKAEGITDKKVTSIPPSPSAKPKPPKSQPAEPGIDRRYTGNRIGRILGKLTIEAFAGNHIKKGGRSVRKWCCLCKCGNRRIVLDCNLNRVTSCGTCGSKLLSV